MLLSVIFGTQCRVLKMTPFISQLRETAKKQPDQISMVLCKLEGYLADNDIRCIFLAARALNDITKNENLIQVLLKKDQFWQNVLTALDKEGELLFLINLLINYW